jgi:hypothetical protein
VEEVTWRWAKPYHPRSIVCRGDDAMDERKIYWFSLTYEAVRPVLFDVPWFFNHHVLKPYY